MDNEKETSINKNEETKLLLNKMQSIEKQGKSLLRWMIIIAIVLFVNLLVAIFGPLFGPLIFSLFV